MDATSEPPARRPTVLAVDDDQAVLHAVERDSRRHLGERYRVLAAASGADGLDLLGRLKPGTRTSRCSSSTSGCPP